MKHPDHAYEAAWLAEEARQQEGRIAEALREHQRLWAASAYRALQYLLAKDD